MKSFIKKKMNDNTRISLIFDLTVKDKTNDYKN